MDYLNYDPNWPTINMTYTGAPASSRATSSPFARLWCLTKTKQIWENDKGPMNLLINLSQNRHHRLEIRLDDDRRQRLICCRYWSAKYAMVDERGYINILNHSAGVGAAPLQLSGLNHGQIWSRNYRGTRHHLRYYRYHTGCPKKGWSLDTLLTVDITQGQAN